MTLISWSTTAALAVFTFGVLGCAMPAQKPLMETRSGVETHENQFCSWTVDRASTGKVIDVHIQNKTTNKPEEDCQKTKTSGKLFIGSTPNNGQEILDIGGVEILIKGSCRWCYVNAFGGLTCIVYQGC